MGNTLFFFISGFTLFLGRNTNFADYYKRRISRIYPTVIAMAIIATLLWGKGGNIVSQLTSWWFINCIMIYYAILWVCRRLKFNLIWVIIVSLVITLSIFLFTYDFKGNSGLIYGNKTFRYFIYFTFMAQGAYMGVRHEGYKFRIWHLGVAIASMALWYGINSLAGNSAIQLLSIPVLFAFSYSIYLTSKAPFFQKAITRSYILKPLMFCGGLCLEAYLIQFYIFTSILNSIFPLNIPIVMSMVVFSAWVLHMFGNLIMQTFDSRPFRWREIPKV